MKILRFYGKRTAAPIAIMAPVSLLALLLLASCGGEMETVTYRANIKPLNAEVTGMNPSGTATLRIKGDSLTINVKMHDLPPGMAHLQHYHGFVDGRDAECATMNDDTNNDGIVDLIETHAVSGVTLVPFHDDPAGLKIKTHTYPTADGEGNLSYEKSISLAALERAMARKHDIGELAFEKRVIYVHGIDPNDSLPETVRSLPGVPAHITLPIACGKFRPGTETERGGRGSGY